MKHSWVRGLDVLFKVVLVAGIIAGGYFFVIAIPVKKAWSEWVLNKHPNYLGCYDLPFYPEVKKVFDANQNALVKIKNLGATNTQIVVLKCKGWDQGIEFVKADVLINFHTRTEKNEIEKFLGQTFFGMPYRAEPVK